MTVYELFVVGGIVFGLFFALISTCVLHAVVLVAGSRLCCWAEGRAEWRLARTAWDSGGAS